MEGLAIVLAALFWVPVIYWIYNSSVKPKVERHKDKNEAARIAKKFGGLSNLYQPQIDFFKEAGFKVISEKPKKIRLKSDDATSVALLEISPTNTDSAHVDVNIEDVGANSITCDFEIDRNDPQLQILYRSLYESYLSETVDEGSSLRDRSAEDSLAESHLGRQQVFKLRWDYLASINSSEGKTKTIDLLSSQNVCPEGFSENYRYLLFNAFPDREHSPYNLKKYTTPNVENAVRLVDTTDYTLLPIWFLAAFPNVSEQIIKSDYDSFCHPVEIRDTPDIPDALKDSIAPSSLKDLLDTSGSNRSNTVMPFKKKNGKAYSTDVCIRVLSKYEEHRSFETSCTFRYWSNSLTPPADHEFLSPVLN
jgi:hypothetical protein